MRSLAFVTVISAVTIWFLLYANELRLGTPLFAEIVYVVTLFSPSVCFWFLLRSSSKLAVESGGDRSLVSLTVLSIMACTIGAILLTLSRPSLRDTSPALFSVVTAVYVCGLIITLAALVRLTAILWNHLLGPLALAAAIGTASGFWIASFLVGRHAPALGRWSSLLIDSGCIVTLLLAFFCLLKGSRHQVAMGIAAIIGLALLFVYTRFEIFLSIWLDGELFWPFVILCGLIFEAILLRVGLRNAFRTILALQAAPQLHSSTAPI